MRQLAAFYTFAAVLLAAQLVSGAPETPAVAKPQNGSGGSARGRYVLPELPSFEAYKQTFQKVYSTPEEELARQQSYLSKVLRAMVSMVNYKRGNSTFYLGINPTSDLAKDEIEKTKNHFIEGSLPFVSEEEIKSAFKLLEGESELEMLERVARKFPESQEIAELRDELKWATQRSAQTIPANPLANSAGQQNYQSNFYRQNTVGQQQQSSRVVGGIRQQIADVDWTEMWSREKLEGHYVKNRLNQALAEYRSRVEQTKPQDNGEDKVFVDHRQSNCFWPPRNQMLCGGCWAFAYTALAEWLYCKTTGQLLAFSEQYLIDCGHYKSLAGCSGGHPVRAGEFVHNFGMELRSAYPFINMDGQCPYDENTDLRTTGFVRMNSLKSAFIPLDRWEESMLIGPMLISISIQGSFMDYGGGVYDSAECIPYPEHAVVLVGHGREDGNEYWLIRNSHSTRWGEGGYMKLSKKTKCIFPSFGYFLGLENGQLNPQMQVNTWHAANKIQDNLQKIWPFARWDS